MLFTRYNILLFKPGGERLTSFHSRGWLLPVFWLLVLALLAGNILLVRHFLPYAERKQRLAETLDLMHRQNAQLYDTAFGIFALNQEFERIGDLSLRLRVMLNLDEPEPDLAAPAGVGAPVLTARDIGSRADLLRLAHQTYARLHTAMRQEEVLQQQLMREIVLQRGNFTRVPSIWPVRGRFTSRFGYRKNPVTGRVAFHKGIDITAPTGTPIRAPADGVVIAVKWFSTYGKIVDIDHQNGIKTRYAHMSSYKVEEGQEVKRGQVIGAVGNTGRSQAPHLHYEVYRNGRLVNPIYYIMD